MKKDSNFERAKEVEINKIQGLERKRDNRRIENYKYEEPSTH